MARSSFEITKLGDLDDGRPAAQINQAISRCVEDCANRPGVSKARQVSILIDITPRAGEEGVCDSADLDFTVRSKVPPSHTKTFNMGVNPKGGLIYNPASQDNIHQRTLDESE